MDDEDIAGHHEISRIGFRPYIAEIIRTDYCPPCLVLLVASIQVVPAAGSKQAYLLFLSDGEKVIQAILRKEMHRFVTTEETRVGSYVMLDKYELVRTARNSGEGLVACVLYLAIADFHTVGQQTELPTRIERDCAISRTAMQSKDDRRNPNDCDTSGDRAEDCNSESGSASDKVVLIRTGDWETSPAKKIKLDVHLEVVPQLQSRSSPLSESNTSSVQARDEQAKVHQPDFSLSQELSSELNGGDKENTPNASPPPSPTKKKAQWVNKDTEKILREARFNPNLGFPRAIQESIHHYDVQQPRIPTEHRTKVATFGNTHTASRHEPSALNSKLYEFTGLHTTKPPSRLPPAQSTANQSILNLEQATPHDPIPLRSSSPSRPTTRSNHPVKTLKPVSTPLNLHTLNTLLHYPKKQGYRCDVLAVVESISPHTVKRLKMDLKRDCRLIDPTIDKKIQLSVFVDAENWQPEVGTVALFRNVKNHRWEGLSLNAYSQDCEGVEWFVPEPRVLLGEDVDGLREWWERRKREEKEKQENEEKTEREKQREE
ncbi:MAG: hypothetical protein M1827_006010 [Pycnora praestabilis]|nr:MAG: hypothetical protein M1827_006010 [Pycnora praestabilis]